MAKQTERRDYWSECEQVYFLDGWGLGLTENGYRISLGKEEDVLMALETEQLNDDLQPKQREVMNWVLDYRKENGYGSGKGSMEREGDNGATGRKPKSTRQSKKSKRLPLRLPRTKNKSLSSR